MEFIAKSGHPEKQRTSCLVIGIFETKRFTSHAERIDKASEGYITQILKKGDLEGKTGQKLLLHNVPNILAERVLLIGLGKEREFDEKAFQTSIETMWNVLTQIGVSDAVCHLTELSVKARDTDFNIRTTVHTLCNLQYQFDRYKTQKNSHKRIPKRLILSLSSRKELNIAEEQIKITLALSEGMKLTKDLANEPANVCTPSFIAERALEIAKELPQVEVAVLEKKELENLKMGCLLGVGQGSVHDPLLITVQYKGTKREQKPIVLVGKGVTFDTGGHSLKAPLNMIGMKYDMAGAATVLGLIYIVAKLKLPVHVVGVIPSVENMPGPYAYRPDDILTSMSGQTVEVLNTDAEGRLILCDALTYSERFNPDCVIDIATLTGACVVALGHIASGLYANHQPLANELLTASEEAGDKAWQMPLWDDYHPLLESKFADMANVGGPTAGSITAACFLSKFTKKMHWAHLDVAGTACKFDGSDKGATGRPIPLLLQFILNRINS